MNRREFIRSGAMIAAGFLLGGRVLADGVDRTPPGKEREAWGEVLGAKVSYGLILRDCASAGAGGKAPPMADEVRIAVVTIPDFKAQRTSGVAAWHETIWVEDQQLSMKMLQHRLMRGDDGWSHRASVSRYFMVDECVVRLDDSAGWPPAFEERDAAGCMARKIDEDGNAREYGLSVPAGRDGRDLMPFVLLRRADGSWIGARY